MGHTKPVVTASTKESDNTSPTGSNCGTPLDFHNPDNLRAEQIGEGYRLLLKSEIKTREPKKEIEVWLKSHSTWKGWYNGSSPSVTYRVPLSTWPLPEDPYRALKEAHAAGKVIEFNPGDGAGWRAHNPDWTALVECYRIKPEDPWTLGRSVNGFTLAEDQEWHRLDGWTQEMLPAGWRPLLKGEVKAEMDQSNYYGKWLPVFFPGKVVHNRDHCRTQRPLPTSEAEQHKRAEEPQWIPWSGGECPLKDDDVDEWEIRFRDGEIRNTDIMPQKWDWLRRNSISDIIAYRVLKWKEKKEPSPTDNDAWESLLRTNAQLGKRVAELESQVNHLLNDQAHYIAGDGEKADLEAKLYAAQYRLAQLEWRPVSVKPTKEDADEYGWIQVFKHDSQLGIHQYHNLNNVAYWQPFAPPPKINTDRVEFEKWWKGYSFDTSEYNTAFAAWKAAREEVK